MSSDSHPAEVTYQSLGDPFSALVPPTAPAAPVAESLESKPVAKAAPGVVKNKQAGGRVWLRPGDSGLGLPDPEPVGAQEVPEAATEAWEQAQAEALRARVERHLRAGEQGPAGWAWPRALTRLLRSVVLLGSCLLGLFLLTQAATFYGHWKAMEPLGQWFIGGLFVLFSLVLTWYLGRLLLFVGKLRKNQQVPLKALDALRERRHLQALAREQASEALGRLRQYLKDYPHTEQNAPGIPLKAAQRAGLHRARARLLEYSRGNAPAQWIADFHAAFQTPLDEVAAERIEAFARRAGLATAASPNPLLDQAIVLYCSTAMLSELLKIYHVRPGFGQAGLLLAQAISHTYLAGILENATEAGADSLAQSLGDVASPLGADLAKAIGAKTAEGGLNYLMVRRLGRAAMRLLQPVRAK